MIGVPNKETNMRATGLVKNTIKQQSRHLGLIGAVGLTLALIFASLPLVLADDTEAATRPGYNGRIVFITSRDGNQQVYSMNADGSDQARLTNDSGRSITPSFSPDGSRIIYSSNRSGNYEVYIMNADGSDQTNLTNNTGDDYSPVFSPDGSKIIFHSERDGNAEIYTMNIDGTEQANLTNSAEGDEFMGSFNPDGSKIAFWSDRDSNDEVYIMNADGSNQTNLTNSAGMDRAPVFSPDGSKIIFFSDQDGGTDIFSINPDGSNLTNLTNTPDYIEDVYEFSPDGSKLAIIRFTNDWSQSALVITDQDGNYQAEYDFTSSGTPYIDGLSWSPDGRWLLFLGQKNTAYDHYSFNLDTETLVQLTSDGKGNYDSNWQPLPNAPPVAVDDSVSVTSNTPASIDVLANDTDEEALSGENLVVSVQPSYGAAFVVDGKVQYIPSDGHVGVDSLTYEICDSFLSDQKCSTGIVSLTVKPAVSVMGINGENYKPNVSTYTTSNLRPVFSGTATPGSKITVEIHSDPIVLTTTADQNGNWSTSPNFDLPAGDHMIYISATLAGLTTELGVIKLSVGALASTGASLWSVLITTTGAVVASLFVLARARLA